MDKKIAKKVYRSRIKLRLNDKLLEHNMSVAKLCKQISDMHDERFDFNSKTIYSTLSPNSPALNLEGIIAICELLDLDYSWVFTGKAANTANTCVQSEVAGIDENYTCLTDPDYMNTYHCYMYKRESNSLYNYCILEMRNDGMDKSTAMLTVIDGHAAYGRSRQFIDELSGTPVLCRQEGVVYILFRSVSGRIMFMCFNYKTCKSPNEDLVKGFILTSNPTTQTPYVRKIIMSTKKLGRDKMPYIESLLKICSDKLVIPYDNLDRFFKRNSQNEVVRRFRDEFLPKLESYKKTCYVIENDELLSHLTSGLSAEDRSEIITLLKTVSMSGHSASINTDTAVPD